MNDLTQKKIDNLMKSARNMLGATNKTQREAHETFLIQRAQELSSIRDDHAAWLETADNWLDANMPEIAADADHTRNIRWLDRLHEYEGICKALESAWSMLMQSKAGEPA